MRASNNDSLWLIGFAILIWWLATQGGASPLPNIVAPTKAVKATYVFEKDDTAVPPAVRDAINQLNRRGVIATTWDDDTTDGEGEIPAQYKVALEEARKAGTPLLVVESESGVIATVKNPTTAEAVLEAVP